MSSFLNRWPRALTCVVLISLLCLGSCKVTSEPETEKALPAIPSKFNEIAKPDQHVDKTWPDSGWWTQLGSKELCDLIELGKVTNLDIATAVERVHKAQSVARIAGVGLLPSATVNTYVGNTSNLVRGGNATTSEGLVLNINYEVDFWGKNSDGQREANAKLLSDRFDSETVALTVTTDIANTYLQVLSLRDQLAIAKQNVNNAERVMRLIEAQGRAGSASRLDLARQGAALANVRALVPNLEQQEREARAALAILVGQSSQSFTVNETGLGNIQIPEVNPGLPSELLLRRPDIRREEAKLVAAQANMARTHAALYPSIQLSGFAGAESNALFTLLDISSLVKNVSINMVAPLFDGGKARQEHQISIEDKQIQLQKYRSTVLTAFSEVDIALGQVHSLSDISKLKKIELEEASIAFELSERRYRDGAEDLKTVLDTQRPLYAVENDIELIKLRRLKALVNLYKAMGGGWQDTTDHAQLSPLPN